MEPITCLNDSMYLNDTNINRTHKLTKQIYDMKNSYFASYHFAL